MSDGWKVFDEYDRTVEYVRVLKTFHILTNRFTVTAISPVGGSDE